MWDKENPNPYAAPQDLRLEESKLAADSPFQTEGGPAGMWRDGYLMVLDKRARFPNRCVKSNEPCERWLKRNLSWHHPAVYLAILAHLFIYIILVLVLRKTATIYIGLSDTWFAKRRRTILISWILGLLSIVLFGVGIASVETSDTLVWLILLGIFMFFGALLYGLIASRMVSPKRIDDNYVWLKGVHPEFLADLPPWPYPDA